MNIANLIFREILHRRFNFLMSVLAVFTAVGLFTFFLTTAASSKKETTRVMRDLGYNLRIIHRDTDMNTFWTEGFSPLTFPEEAVHPFVEHQDLSYNHLLAMLHRKVTYRGREAILTGIASEVAPENKKKSSMIFAIAPGTVYVGYELARREGLSRGDRIELLGRDLEVASCLSESGTRDDATLYVNLADAQALLEMPGRINEIKALECLCRDPGKDSLTLLREQLGRVLPEGKVIQLRDMARARERQRLMVEGYFAWTGPLVLVVCAAWIAVLAMLNVRDRRREIGVMRALGFDGGRIAALFLGRAAVVGLAGGAIGFAGGTLMALHVGPELFQVTARSIRPDYSLLAWALAAAPAFAAVAAFVPATMAVTQDPAETLRRSDDEETIHDDADPIRRREQGLPHPAGTGHRP